MYGSPWAARVRWPRTRRVLAGAAVCALLSGLAARSDVRADEAPSVDFRREILPLLSDNCFQCHGPDEAQREAGLRLDENDAAKAPLESGHRAIVPGDPGASEILRRITATDLAERMPPRETGKSLSESEITRIRRWIDEGAPWAKHWAFEPPARRAVPEEVSGWDVANPVDAFLHRAIRREGLAPEERAEKEALIRRVTLALTGLPPTVAEVDAFLADATDKAYDRVVDRLLGSIQYAEHMARFWLDAARYADTHGLHLDNERSIWPYRDWVIESFHRNQPFDEFTIEQLAGDLPARGDSRAARRHRIQPLQRDDERRRVDRRRVLRPLRRRSGRNDIDRMARPHVGLRRLPRPQVRSDHAEGLLSALLVLLQPHRTRDGRQRAPASAECQSADATPSRSAQGVEGRARPDRERPRGDDRPARVRRSVSE